MDGKTSESRRQFLRFLAGSPLLAMAGYAHLSLDQLFAADQGRLQEELISSAEEALNVFDFRPVAQNNLTIAHFGYLETGTDNDRTVRANREGFNQFGLRPRRLVDVGKVDMSTEIFGRRWETPIVLAPVSSQAAFHSQGEIAVARAARSCQSLQILSTVTTTSVEAVNQAREEPVRFGTSFIRPIAGITRFLS